VLKLRRKGSIRATDPEVLNSSSIAGCAGCGASVPQTREREREERERDLQHAIHRHTYLGGDTRFEVLVGSDFGINIINDRRNT
jgi:hypothetical protein